jgi:electron transfer flavoprotein alpha/beta subunit
MDHRSSTLSSALLREGDRDETKAQEEEGEQRATEVRLRNSAQRLSAVEIAQRLPLSPTLRNVTVLDLGEGVGGEKGREGKGQPGGLHLSLSL